MSTDQKFTVEDLIMMTAALLTGVAIGLMIAGFLVDWPLLTS